MPVEKLEAKQEDSVTTLFAKTFGKATEPVVVQKFEENYSYILSLKGPDRPGVEAGQTVPKAEWETTKTLIEQTYCQLLSQMIDRNTFKVKVFEVQRFDHFRAHLAKHFPETLPKTPLKLLIRNFYRTHADPENQQPMRDETDQKVQQLLSIQPLGKGEKGLNPTSFVLVGGKKAAIVKSERDESYGITLKNTLPLDRLSKEKLAAFAGVNESIASHLGILFQGHLAVPLTLSGKKHTVHAFVENKGTLSQVRAADPDIVADLDIDASQRFVFTQLIMRNADCHGNNILVTDDDEPIGIDFGRSLLPDPSALRARMRAAFLDFPCLDMPVSTKEKDFYEQLNVEETMQSLKEALEEEYADKLQVEGFKDIFDETLLVLQARLLLIKEGVAMGATQRELLALDLPPLNTDDDNDHQVFENALPQNPYAPTREEVKRFQRVLAREAVTRGGFVKAWDSAYASGNFNIEAFKKTINIEIEKLQALGKQYGPDELYGPEERNCYKIAQYDVTPWKMEDL